VDAEFDDAIRMGRENAIVIELSRRHCQRMEYFEAGGRGMLEAATGLPINMRRIRCPKANGTMGGANLEIVAVAFYKEHCIGCDLRASTGQLPTLSTLVEEQDAAEDAEESAAAERLSRAQAEWEARAQRRRSQAVGADPALVSVIDDLERLDPRPGSAGSDASSAALRRLMALADRAPQTYSEKTVGLMLDLLDADAGNGLLGPLRVLARGRVELRDPLVKRALVVLAEFADPDAARVLVQFSDLVSPSQLTTRVVHSLVEAAVGLQADSIGHLGPNRSSDPAALLLAAQVAPDTLTLVLSEMLPGPQAETSLLLPTGSRPQPLPGRHSARDRGTAAAALGHLLVTHAKLATQLADALIRNAMIPGDRYDTFPDRRVSQTLARFLAEDVGDTRKKLEAAGASASDEQRERLFRAWQSVAGLLEPDGAERIGGDPALSEILRDSVRESLFSVCMGMVGGSWGHDVAFQAAETVERLAERSPRWASSRIDSLLGGAIIALQAQLHVGTSSLVTPADSNPVMASMEAEGRRISFRSAAQRLLRAVEACAVSDPIAAATSLADCIRFEREEDLEAELRWWLLPVIGEVAARHGSHGGVLPIVLPILYTYLVDSSPALRARAITAWASVARRHTLPATLEDLLPVLLADNHVIVATALYESIPVLRLSPTNELKVLGSAVELCLKLPRGEHADLVKALIRTIRTLAQRMPDSPSAIELVALDRASDLDGYDLARVLDGWWSSEARQSGQMARLRLRQVGDPQINDRFNRRDDELVVSLLEVGPGLADLSLDELTSVALSFGPEAVLAGLQIVEVAWRAGRVADATVVAQRLSASLPSTQAFEAQRRLTALVEMALQEDREGESLVTSSPSDEDGGLFTRLSSQLQLRRRARGLLRAEAAGSLLEHHSRMNERADALAKVARQLEKSTRRATPTAMYVRMYAALCHVASALVRLDAALQEGAKDDIKAYRGSVKRLVKALAKEVSSSFGDNDLLTTELAASLATVRSAVKRGEIPALLAKWAKLSIPLVIVEGSPMSRRKPARNQRAESSPPTPIAVVLVSIDGRLMTGPAVLRPNTVYELGVEVQPDEWPKWAERLDLELGRVSHMFRVARGMLAE